ncbi:Uu.00g027100.m01.CDS01 [Anthostomella pinea]|uniref:Uu.00g027100.m01.CDS01 n=1 Tax=Anthostomella pinea TaxID=933095 RepID=A0AAI8V885_9PEZI|nr:Uu.00g027100.m01.CDS01 [Anthostomella pinea]
MKLNPMKLVEVLVSLVGFGLTATISRDPSISSTFVDVPAEVPSDASAVIDPDFPGLAFEEASFVRYAQDDDGNINAFSTNLMEAIYSRTGGKPIIRLGGTSADYGKYLPGQVEPALPVAEQDNYQDVGHTTIGPSYWPLAHNFPNAAYMVQAPLATTNISEAIAWTQTAIDAIGIDSTHSIQVGNEPDLYSDTYTGEGGIELNPPGYQGRLSNESYVGNYTKYVTAIKEAVDVPDGRFFTAFDVSTHFGAGVMKEQYILAVDRCFELGIDADSIIKEVSHHYYQKQAGTAADLGSELMNMSMTHTHLDQYKVRIAWLQQNKPDVPFILNEVGNSLQPTHTYEYQARLGSALWQVDFYLYSMAIGVARINYQQIMHSGFDMWLPVASAGLPAQTFSNYYSQPFVADFIGSSGTTRVAQLSLEGEYENVAAYAAYDGGALSRIAVANLQYWNATSSTEDRGGVTLDLALPDGVESVTVYHLNSPAGAGAAADSITYGGSQWTYGSLGTEVKGVRDDTEVVAVVDGVASVTVASSEAVLVWL